MRPLSRLMVVGGFLLWSATARAQQFGQWAWEGSVGYDQRTSANLIGDTTAADYAERQFRAGVLLKGFLGHPTVGNFSLGLEGSSARYRDGLSSRSKNLGYRGDVSLFPRGKYPLRLFFSRQAYDFTQVGLPPGAMIATPSASTSFGGRLWVRQGFFGGLGLGFERTTVGFAEKNVADQVNESAYADWSGGGAVLRHYRLERRLYDLGMNNFRFRDTTASADEHGTLSPLWRYDLSLIGLRREFIFARASSTLDTANMRSQFSRGWEGGDTLQLALSAGYSGSSAEFHATSADLELRYLWRRRGPWTLSTFVAYGAQEAESTRGIVPRAGVTATWNRRLGKLETTVTGTASYVLFRRTADGQTIEDRTGAYAATATFAYGTTSTLRETLDVSVSRNDLRRSGEGLPQIPDPNVLAAGTGTESLTRARLGLARSFGSSTVGAFAENVRRDVTPLNAASSVRFVDQIYGANIAISSFSVTYSRGNTTVRDVADQRISHQTGSVTWSPWWFVALQGSYAETIYGVRTLPSFQSRRAEAGATFRVGDFRINGTAYQVLDEQAGSPKRTYKGLVWSVARGFGGWLPIVTASVRRGVVR